MKYSYCRVKRQAKRDGRPWKWEVWPFIKKEKNLIPEDTYKNHAPFELTLKEAAEADMAYLAEKWRQKDEKLKRKYCVALKRFNIARDSLDKESREAQEANKKYQVATEEFVRLGKPRLSPFWKYFWLFFLGLAEFPLNGVVFSIFGAGRIETYIMAASMCFAIPLFAHFTGQSIKQEIKVKKDFIILIIVLSIVFLGLIALAIIRAEYLAEMLSDLGIKISPSLAGGIFVIINLLVFSVATLISYEGSHPNQTEYNNKRSEYKRLRKELLKESSEAKRAACKYKKALENLQKAKVKREKEFEKNKEKAKKIKQACEWLQQVYRNKNAEARGREIGSIQCFKLKLASPSIPDVFEMIDWECINSPKTS